MKNPFIKNCCDGIYNSLDVHFTSACDNKCKHCIDTRYCGTGITKPDVCAIAKTIIDNSSKYDDVLFLGGEPCLYLNELLHCVRLIKSNTALKVFVTTSMPKICRDKYEVFRELLYRIDGLNLSVQHHKEDVADKIRCTESKFDRQAYYQDLSWKSKIRINLNIVKPFLYTKEDLTACLLHYDRMFFNEIKLSEIQHGKDSFVSFEEIFGIKLGSPFYHGCQTRIDTSKIIPRMKTPLLLKRSCFMCEETLSASFMDGIKTAYKAIKPSVNNYGVVYEDGTLTKGWK